MLPGFFIFAPTFLNISMHFREWLTLSEIPHPWFNGPKVTHYLPDQKREAKAFTFDSIDMHLELYMPLDDYRKYILGGFNAKFPFENEFVVFDAKNSRSIIGPAKRDLPTLGGHWYSYARFLDGNTTAYWALKGIFEPTMSAATA
jgi:hypothetical protein